MENTTNDDYDKLEWYKRERIYEIFMHAGDYAGAYDSETRAYYLNKIKILIEQEPYYIQHDDVVTDKIGPPTLVPISDQDKLFFTQKTLDYLKKNNFDKDDSDDLTRLLLNMFKK